MCIYFVEPLTHDDMCELMDKRNMAVAGNEKFFVTAINYIGGRYTYTLVSGYDYMTCVEIDLERLNNEIKKHLSGN